MNVSAPASVPDLAGLTLSPATPPDLTAQSSGFAPWRSVGAGAGTSRSFQVALRDLLKSAGETEQLPAGSREKENINAGLTGVPVPAPAPIPLTLPFRFAMPPPQGAASSQMPAGTAMQTVPGSVAGMMSRFQAVVQHPTLVSAQPEQQPTIRQGEGTDEPPGGHAPTLHPQIPLSRFALPLPQGDVPNEIPVDIEIQSTLGGGAGTNRSFQRRVGAPPVSAWPEEKPAWRSQPKAQSPPYEFTAPLAQAVIAAAAPMNIGTDPHHAGIRAAAHADQVNFTKGASIKTRGLNQTEAGPQAWPAPPAQPDAQPASLAQVSQPPAGPALTTVVRAVPGLPVPPARADSASDPASAGTQTALGSESDPAPAARSSRVAGEDLAADLPDLAFAARLLPANPPPPDAPAASVVSWSSVSTNSNTHVGSQTDAERTTEAVRSGPLAADPASVAKATEPDHASGHRQQNEEQGHLPAEKNDAGRDSGEPAARPPVAIERAPIRLETTAAASASAADLQAPAPVRPVPPPPTEIPRLDRDPVEPVTTNPQPLEAHAISVRIADASDQPIELKVTDRAGEVRVTVRTVDPAAAAPLRENLGDLVHTLQQSGFRADTWHPAPSGAMDSDRQEGRPQSESFSGNHTGGQQRQQSGRDRREQNPEKPRWVQEMENSITTNSERSESNG